MRELFPKVPFGERPAVIFVAWVALGLIVSFVEFDGEYWKAAAAVGGGFAMVNIKANDILISLQIVHRQLTPEALQNDDD